MEGTFSQQLESFLWKDESIVNLGIQLLALAGVVALGMGVSQALFHHSIPREDLDRIAERYGKWAARRAEALCPENDVACVEREARRLYEVTQHRR